MGRSGEGRGRRRGEWIYREVGRSGKRRQKESKREGGEGEREGKGRKGGGDYYSLSYGLH